jgi:two-component system CheB/CheR fusion protein
MKSGPDDIKPQHLRDYFSYIRAVRHFSQIHPGLRAEPDIRYFLQAYPDPPKPGEAALTDSVRLLAEREQRLRAIYDGTHEYLCLLSPDGILLETNRASLTFANSSREDVVGRPFWDTIWFQFTPGAPAAIRQSVARAAAGEYIQFDTLIITPTGDARIYDITFDPILDRNGQVIFIVPEGRDITEKKKAEIALHESEDRFRKIFEHAATCICITDLQGRFEQCNPCYCTLVNYTQAELQKLTFSDIAHPDDRDSNIIPFHRLLAGEISQYEIEKRYVRKNGEIVWAHKFVSLLRDDAGHPTRVVALVTDVTERRATEIALKEAKEAAEAANQSKDRFLAVLSHELRTPLTPVLMTAAALRGDESLPADLREQLGMIERNIALEARLIDDLLDLTRINSGKLTMRSTPCDVHSLIALVVEMVRSEALEKKLVFYLRLAAARSFLDGDPARLQQVFWNLIRNAAKFTPPGGSVTVLTSELSCADGSDTASSICIQVTDTGVGFDPAAAERIFQPFEQVSSGPHHGGLGLGLSIARAIVDMHSGVIAASSPGPGAGATFTVTLPGAINPPSHDPGPHSSHGEPDPARPSPLRILLVEDHEHTAQVLTRLLVRDGHHVTSANSLETARAAAALDTFDLLISDLGLPDGTGIELMKSLRAAHGLRGIALSGYGTQDDMRSTHEAGFVTHLVKPVDFSDLRRALRSLAIESI